jgi:hypothetical protein
MKVDDAAIIKIIETYQNPSTSTPLHPMLQRIFLPKTKMGMKKPRKTSIESDTVSSFNGYDAS